MKRLPLAIILIFGASCASQSPDPVASAPAPRTVVIDPASSPITAAAEREIIRRQEAMRRADEAALRAQRQMADGNYEAAMGSSRSALGGGR
jgi:hypothetical protein